MDNSNHHYRKHPQISPRRRIYLKDVKDLLSHCICVKQDGTTPRLDGKKISEIKKVEAVCQSLAVRNLPRCSNSGGATLYFMEMSGVNVEGSFSVANVNTPSKTKSELESKDGSKADSRSTPDGIALYNVNARGSGLLSSNKTSKVYLNHSQFERLQSENNTYGQFISSRNEIRSFISLKDKFNKSVTKTQNGFTRSFEIDSGDFSLPDEERTTSCEDQSSTTQSAKEPEAEKSESVVINLSNNVVGRDLTFTPYQVSRCFRSIDLSSNRVGGVLSVNLPITPHNSLIEKSEDPKEYKLDWHGKVQLRSVDVGSSLELGLAHADSQKLRAISGVELKIIDDKYQFKVGEKKKKFTCEKDTIHVELDHAKTMDFVWALPTSHKPHTCFRWEGVGFRYANWLHPKNSSVNDLIEDLEQWGKLYNKDGSTKEGVSSKPSDPLHYMADYLDQNGHRRNSRNMLAEAKAADFPFWEPWSECWGGEEWLPNCDSAMRNAIARFIFFPTNFGTSPQKALGILFIATLVFYGIYSLNKLYWQRQGRWARLKTARSSFSKRRQLESRIEQYLVVADLRRMLTARSSNNVQSSEPDYSAMVDRLTKRDIRAILDRYAPKPQYFRLDPEEVMHLSAVSGFMQYDRNRQPQDFGLFRYAIDVSIPLIDLHAYSQYFPLSRVARILVTVQHILGWWILTSFLATLAVL